MATTKCVVCNSTLGFDIGFGHNPNGRPHQKTKDGKWTCGPQCARDYNLAQLNSGGSSDNTSSNQSNTSEPEKKSGGFLSGLMGGGGVEDILKTTILTAGLASIGAEKKEIQNKIEYVSKMVFSTNPEELSNQMNELLTIGAGTNSDHKELIKACYEKMDFGVMKLKGLGASVESEFFAKKRESIKPKNMFGF